jgi:autotransporter passenger strand-loop-strand repeat protein
MSTTVLPGHTLNVAAGQTSSGVIVDFGGTLNVSSGGAVVSTIDSGVVNVSSGGRAVSTTVASGGAVNVTVHGLDSASIIQSGGAQNISSGGTARGTIVFGDSIEAQFVLAGGTALSTTLHADRRLHGFGGVSGANSAQFIAFTQIGSMATVSYKPAVGNTSGTLTVASGGVSATVTLVGHYTSTSFASSIVSGYVEITDPLAANGQTGIALGATTTLAYSHHAGATGIPAPIDRAHAAVIALFGNHMAASFVAPADGHGTTAIAGATLTAEPPTQLTHPQRG